MKRLNWFVICALLAGMVSLSPIGVSAATAPFTDTYDENVLDTDSSDQIYWKSITGTPVAANGAVSFTATTLKCEATRAFPA